MHSAQRADSVTVIEYAKSIDQAKTPRKWWRIIAISISLIIGSFSGYIYWLLYRQHYCVIGSVQGNVVSGLHQAFGMRPPPCIPRDEQHGK
jgi:hypothetical protein